MIDPWASSASSHQARVGQALRLLAAEAPLRLTVRGSCMNPLLVENQEVTATAAPRYWPGDVIAFDSRAGSLSVHRVIGYRVRRGRLLLQTRADASGTLDRPVDPRQVIGRIAEVEVSARQRLRALVRFARLWMTGWLP